MTADLRSLDCIAFGVPFQLTAESDVLLATMRQCAPVGMQTCQSISADARTFTLRSLRHGAGYQLEVDLEVVGEGAALQPLLDQLARDLMVNVANHAPDRIFVHAGVVGWKGRALVLPGASFAGKTTLVAELVRAGAVCYSDEYAVVDEQGQVHPYARELRMRQEGSLEQRGVAIAQLNGVAGTVPLRVSHVVFTEFIAAAQWNPEPVSAGMAVLEMLRHAIPVQRTPARVMAALATMMETATAVRTQRGEARKVARLLIDAMITGGASR